MDWAIWSPFWMDVKAIKMPNECHQKKAIYPLDMTVNSKYTKQRSRFKLTTTKLNFWVVLYFCKATHADGNTILFKYWLKFVPIKLGVTGNVLLHWKRLKQNWMHMTAWYKYTNTTTYANNLYVCLSYYPNGHDKKKKKKKKTTLIYSVKTCNIIFQLSVYKNNWKHEDFDRKRKAEIWYCKFLRNKLG